MIEDPAADEFVRGQRVDALIMIARQQPELRPEVVGYLERFPSSDFDMPETLCSSWAFAVATLGLAHLEPQVQEAFEHQWISPLEVNYEFFRKQLRIAVEEGEAPGAKTAVTPGLSRAPSTSCRAGTASQTSSLRIKSCPVPHATSCRASLATPSNAKPQRSDSTTSVHAAAAKSSRNAVCSETAEHAFLTIYRVASEP